MPDMTQVTKDTIRHAKKGDRQAITTIYNAYADAIYRYVLLRVDNRMTAEDITADVFARMVKDLPGYRISGAPFEAWLYRIAAARIIDHRRKQRHRQHAPLKENVRAFETDPEGKVLKLQQATELQDALMQLNEQDRLVIVLRFVERKSHREVAEVIGKNISTVRSIQHRALNKLAQAMGLEE